MKKIILLFCLLMACVTGFAQNKNFIALKQGKFITGDNAQWKDAAFDDATWKDAKIGEVWQNQGFPDYHGYAWYRIRVKIPSSLKTQSYWKDSLRVYLAHVNDADETYLNGKLIGKTGAFPTDKGGYQSKWPAIRNYHVATNAGLIKWDAENVIAIKVFDGGGTGGIFMGEPYIDMLEKFDGIQFNQVAIKFTGATASRTLHLKNTFNTPISGTFKYNVVDDVTQKIIASKNAAVVLKPFEARSYVISFPHREGVKISYSFTENVSRKQAAFTEIAPYILTPVEKQSPLVNGAAVLGVHAGSPVIWKIPVSGARPLTFKVDNLPVGLVLDKQKGTITGTLQTNGSYTMQVHVSNKYGSNQSNFTIKAGADLALTPPMGWNSWNCWGLNVSEDKVKASAQAMLSAGLANYGWNYINIDDGWQAEKRAADGTIVPNEKFSNMTGLGEALHSEGLKFGIYSSPGARTCGGYLGSLGHEAQDAETYFKWGIDYLKYDLCSYSDNIAGDTTLIAQQKPYELMGNELKKYKRDLIYSICQYGIHDVWKWGKQMNGNLWRTTEDITDTWESLYGIGFSQTNNAAYAGPGGWNDPDMLILGEVGWGENLHPTRLNPYEQYTHITLWSMLAAPMLIGCDMSKLDNFTLNLLKNREVIAIDQDVLGKQALCVVNENNIQVWTRPLANGSIAVAVFNLGDKFIDYPVNLPALGIKGKKLHDVWRQADVTPDGKQVSFKIPPHGTKLITII